jgi:hypothetical protein
MHIPWHFDWTLCSSKQLLEDFYHWDEERYCRYDIGFEVATLLAGQHFHQ